MASIAQIDGNLTLDKADPEIYDLVEREKHRQWSGLELIASEVQTSVGGHTRARSLRASCSDCV